MPLTHARRRPRATYRVQLTPQFTFAELERRLPYLRTLGISDLYLSPIFTPTPGSQHGYDVCDYNSINPELGGREGFDRLGAAAQSDGIGLLLDFVPNHMGVAGHANAWWRDVLESGPASPYANFFDIQWTRPTLDSRPRVLVPWLEGQYGRMLEENKLQLDYADGFVVRYGESEFPVAVGSFRLILDPLAAASPELSRILDEARIGEGSPEPAQQLSEEARVKERLIGLFASDPALRSRLRERITAINSAPTTELNQLLDAQHYRLARWKTGMHEINYRRFFAISSLIGMHMEDSRVFAAAHELLGQLVRDAGITGLRVDHIDGLRQPADYLDRLQALREAGTPPLYVLVEKILHGFETIPPAWPVHGTTGYEFIDQLASLLVDSAAEGALTAVYQEFTGDRLPYAEAVAEKKQLIMREMFADVIDLLGSQLAALVAEDLRWRDFTRQELITAVTILTAELSVYRTYRANGKLSAADRQVIETACEDAQRRHPRQDPQPVSFLRDVLVGAYPPASAPDDFRARVSEWVLTWQQYTGAITAKSVEDTVFYTYCRFVALNEVGCDPAVFGRSVASFHAANQRRLETQPYTLLATSTHDTKMSEDVRARLYALSEFPGEWAAWVREWQRLTSAFVGQVDGQPAPDLVDQYRLFQILLGAWPLHPAEITADFRTRMREHVRKAVREAKRHTSELNPNESYLAACDAYVDRITSGEIAGPFLASFVPAANRIARAGLVNSLVQAILKATCPGVPDFYQGCEIWNLSLVDPDNRRPVDYARLESAQALAGLTPAERLNRWRDGGLKFWVTQTLLQLRARQPELFAQGSYRPIHGIGAFSDNLVAFVRTYETEASVIVVPRLTAQIGLPPIGPAWDDTVIALPPDKGEWKDLFTGESYAGDSPLLLRDLFRTLPFAVLCSPPA